MNSAWFHSIRNFQLDIRVLVWPSIHSKFPNVPDEKLYFCKVQKVEFIIRLFVFMFA